MIKIFIMYRHQCSVSYWLFVRLWKNITFCMIYHLLRFHLIVVHQYQDLHKPVTSHLRQFIFQTYVLRVVAC